MIVNQSDEVRTVLRAGSNVEELKSSASATDQGLAIAQSSPPDLVVMDLEEVSPEPDVTARRFYGESIEPACFVFLEKQT